MSSLDDKTKARLAKFVALFDAENDGERSNAIGKAADLLRQHKLKMVDLPAVFGGGSNSGDALQLMMLQTQVDCLHEAVSLMTVQLTKAMIGESSAERARDAAEAEVRLVKKEVAMLRRVGMGAKEAQLRAMLRVAESVHEATQVENAKLRAELKQQSRTPRRSNSQPNIDGLRARLREEARKRLRDDDAVRLFLTTRHPKLGMLWPVDVCVNDEGLQACLAVLGRGKRKPSAPHKGR